MVECEKLHAHDRGRRQAGRVEIGAKRPSIIA